MTYFWTPAGGGNFWAFWDLKMRLLKGKWPRNESKIATFFASGGVQNTSKSLILKILKNFVSPTPPPCFEPKSARRGGSETWNYPDSAVQAVPAKKKEKYLYQHEFTVFLKKLRNFSNRNYFIILTKNCSSYFVLCFFLQKTVMRPTANCLSKVFRIDHIGIAARKCYQTYMSWSDLKSFANTKEILEFLSHFCIRQISYT